MTDNHDYNTPAEGATDWHVPLNENFEELDVDVEVRDVEANRASYDPNAGAKFVETDTGIVFLGDGSEWQPAFALGRYGRGGNDLFESLGVILGFPDNEVAEDVAGATISGGGAYRPGTDDSQPNRVRGNFGTIGGGRANTVGKAGEIEDWDATIGGGTGNVVELYGGTIGGGTRNKITGKMGTIGGGLQNEADARATIGGGSRNDATGSNSTIAGGISNKVTGDSASVGGGAYNAATGSSATVPGGESCEANGKFSFAAGKRAFADADGAFVWGDSSDQKTVVTKDNEFKVQAGGGVVFYSKSDHSSGVSLAQGSGSWSSSSSRKAKENLQAVDPGEVLDGVRGLDVSTWSYVAQDGGTIHMGPMAEDFHDAFGLGEDEQRIATVDADGVAFAAIQELADRLDQQVLAIEDQREENAALRRENEALEARLAALEERVAAGVGGD